MSGEVSQQEAALVSAYEDYEKLFSKRYTEEDEVFMKHMERGMEAPPIVENFWSRPQQDSYRNRGEQERSHGSYNRQNREGGGWNDQRSGGRDRGRQWNDQRGYRDRDDNRGDDRWGDRNRWGNQRGDKYRDRRDDSRERRDYSGR